MPEKIERDALYSSEDVAAMLKVKPAAVRQWIRTGRLPAAKLGKRYWTRGAALLNLVTAGFDKKVEAGVE